jgi:hypothetical protein
VSPVSLSEFYLKDTFVVNVEDGGGWKNKVTNFI